MITIAQIATTKLVVRRGRANRRSRWSQAFSLLEKKDRADLKFLSTSNDCTSTPVDVIAAVEKKKAECERKQWIAYKRSDGKEVKVREVLEKIVGWVQRFKAVGDIVVQVNPLYAGAPWAAVRFILEAASSDIETCGEMAEGLEYVSRMIVQCAEFEKQTLGVGALRKIISDMVTKLYVEILKYLANAWRHYNQRTSGRVVKSIFHSSRKTIQDIIGRISDKVDEIYRLANMADWEENKMQNIRIELMLQDLHSFMIDSASLSIQERRDSVRRWLEPVFTDSVYEFALKLRHDSTCDWIVNTPCFRDWLTEKEKASKMLWIYGPPGFGKTVLCARIIHHLKSDLGGEVVYFFCSAEDQARQHVLQILKSCIAQLIGQSQTALEAIFMEDYLRQRIEELRQPTRSELWKALKYIVTNLSNCYIVIDGFDECSQTNDGPKYHNQDARSQFLAELIQNLKNTGVRVLLISRDYSDIREELTKESDETKSWTIFKHGITKEDNAEDISSFSKSLFEKKLPKMNEELRTEMADRASTKSEGMFLWLHLLNDEIKRGATKRQLDRLLSEMPRGIDEAYQRELDRILDTSTRKDARDRAIAILRWVLFAVRPLTVRELAEALAVTFDNSDSEYPEDDLPDWSEDGAAEDYINENIRKPCGSLIEILEQEQGSSLDSHTVRFVHFSVKEFLLKPLENGQVRSDTLRFQPDTEEHDALAIVCLRYLCYPVFNTLSTGNVDNDDQTLNYPFLAYAASNWYTHALYGHKLSKNVSIYTRNLFNPSVSNWLTWAKLYEANDSFLSEMAVDEEDKAVEMSEPKEYKQSWNPSPVYYVSLLGLTDMIQYLAEEGLDYEANGGRYGFPLGAAAANDHILSVDALITLKADVNRQGGEYKTALIAAAARSSESMCRILIKAGANMEDRDNLGETALHHASRRGSLDIVRLLVAEGADKDARSNHSSTPIHTATFAGHTKIVEFLVGYGADLNVQDRRGNTPLHWAALFGQTEILKLLLEHGAKPDVYNEDVFIPLHYAAWSSGAVAQILLDHGASLNAPATSGHTPLYFAIQNKNLSCIRVLVLHNGSLDEGGAISNGDLLELAITSREREIVEIILQRETATLIQKSYAQTSLMPRSTVLVEELVKKFEEAVGNKELSTIMDFALLVARQKLLTMLSHEQTCESNKIPASEPDASPNAQTLWTEKEQTRLNDQEWISRELKEMLFDKIWYTSPLKQQLIDALLRGAVLHQSLDLIELLLKKGAGIHSAGWGIKSAIVLAAENNLYDVVKLLVESQANFTDAATTLLMSLERVFPRGISALEAVKALLRFRALEAGLKRETVDKEHTHNCDWKKVIHGVWSGHYTYNSSRAAGQTRIEVSESQNVFESPADAWLSSRKGVVSFSGTGNDEFGWSEVHGQVSSEGVVVFIQLFEHNGWWYKGQLNSENKLIRGVWGSYPGSSGGDFSIEKLEE